MDMKRDCKRRKQTRCQQTMEIAKKKKREAKLKKSNSLRKEEFQRIVRRDQKQCYNITKDIEDKNRSP